MLFTEVPQPVSPLFLNEKLVGKTGEGIFSQPCENQGKEQTERNYSAKISSVALSLY
jgi:hypothetical protein